MKVWNFQDSIDITLGKLPKTSLGGGCFNLAAFGRKMMTPPIIYQKVMDKLYHNVIDPP